MGRRLWKLRTFFSPSSVCHGELPMAFSLNRLTSSSGPWTTSLLLHQLGIFLLSGEQCRHFLGTQVFRLLSVLVEGVNLDEHELGQSNRNVLAPRSSSLVFIKHDDDLAVAVGVSFDQLLLCGRHGAAHQGNYPATTELVKLHAPEESLHNDQRSRLFASAVKVEQFQ